MGGIVKRSRRLLDIKDLHQAAVEDDEILCIGKKMKRI